MPSKREKNETRKAKKEGGEKAKVKVKTAVSLLNAKTTRNFVYANAELHKLIFCIWIRRLRSDQKTARLASKHVFLAKSPGATGLMGVFISDK